MLYLGSDANIPPNNSWEALGIPTMIYYPIQLHMANKYNIVSIGRLENVEVDLVEVKTSVEFEVI